MSPAMTSDKCRDRQQPGSCFIVIVIVIIIIIIIIIIFYYYFLLLLNKKTLSVFQLVIRHSSLQATFLNTSKVILSLTYF